MLPNHHPSRPLLSLHTAFYRTAPGDEAEEPVLREFKYAQGNVQNVRCSSSIRFRYVKPITIKMVSKNKFIFLEQVMSVKDLREPFYNK